MDGAVGVRSKVGQGSTFWITARFERLAQSSDAASAMTSGTLQIASEAVSPLVAQHLPTSFVVTPTLADEDTDGRLVLLAEDHQVNQKVARMQLENLGYQVVVVNTGRQAVDALVDRDRYGLVLMDVQMPELDGFSATRLIRKAEIEGGRRIPIIAMTASTMEGDRDACLAAGMDAYISKPVNRDSLREVLEAWMPPVEDTGEKFLDSRQSVPAG
jgi:CheY-like chemotaxis protein